jgi:isoleucyl-tRNA synthetase
VAEDGRKMSKSLGNSIEPQEIVKQHGADVLRLWVALVDYKEEQRLGKEILARVVEAYRKLRNTLRYLLQNLYDFNPATDMVAPEKLQDVDRYILARYADVAKKVLASYDAFDYTPIVQAVTQFAIVDLSAFYLDVSKDRLYTFGAASEARRSAQTAMYIMVDGLVRLLAPILTMTTDELWRALPNRRENSVHLADFPAAADLDRFVDPALTERWATLIDVRNVVNQALETQRKAKVIGAPLEAHVTLATSGALLDLLRAHAADLPMLFITSQASLQVRTGETAAAGIASGIVADVPVTVSVARADGVKCQRCWRYVPEVSADPAFEGICSRCVDALASVVR